MNQHLMSTFSPRDTFPYHTRHNATFVQHTLCLHENYSQQLLTSAHTTAHILTYNGTHDKFAPECYAKSAKIKFASTP